MRRVGKQKASGVFFSAYAQTVPGKTMITRWTPHAELVLFGVLYAVFSSTLLVANKWVLTVLAAPSFVMMAQFAATAFVVYLLSSFSPTPVRLDTHPFETKRHALWMIVCVLLQFVTIQANMMSLHLLGVDRVILLRIFAMFPIALGDWIWNERELPPANSWICFACLASAVFFVFGAEHAALTTNAVAWGVAYFAFISADQVLLKRFTKAVDMNDSNRTFWMNLTAVPVTAALVLTGPDYYVVADRGSRVQMSSGIYTALVVSCVLAAGISYTAWGLRRRASAVTFSLVGVVCKIASMALNYVFLDHASPVSIVIIALGIASSYFYEQAPMRSVGVLNEKAPVSAMELPKARVNLKLIALLVAIVCIGSAQFATNTTVPASHFAANTTAIGAPRGSTLSAVPAGDVAAPVGAAGGGGGGGTTTPEVVLDLLRVQQEVRHADEDRRTSAAAAQRNALYSWFRCVGDSRAASVPVWKYRSCHFKNVCYDGNAAGTLTYFASPDDDVVESDLSSGTMVPYETDARVNVDEYKFTVNRDTGNGAVMQSKSVMWAHSETQGQERTVLVPANYFIPAVWTHLVMDNLYPIYRVLELFGLEYATVDPVWLSDPCRSGYRDGCQFSDTRFNPQWIQLLTRHRYNLSRLQDVYAPRRSEVNSTYPKYVCFTNVVTGLSLFSDHAFGDSGHGRNLNKPDWPVWGTGSHLWRFRLHTMRAAGIAAPQSLSGRCSAGNADIIFLRKGSKTWSPNALDPAPAVAALRQALGARNYTNVIINDTVYLERMTLREQMEIMAHAKVVVSQVGSTAYGAFWLGHDASLVLIERGELLDYYFWSNLPYIHTKYVKWTPDTMAPLVNAVLAGLARYANAYCVVT